MASALTVWHDYIPPAGLNPRKVEVKYTFPEKNEINRTGLDMNNTVFRCPWCGSDPLYIENSWETMAQVPARTDLSDTLSRDLKKRGFNFVGSTICYAFMQSIGMVNDHLAGCFRCEEIRRIGADSL